VTLGGTGIANFADKNVGTHKTVTVSGYTLSGADAGNYSLVQPTGLKANISKADLALTGLSAGNKVYDATTVATLTGTPSVSPFGSDSVTLGGTGIANFADKNVGTHKTVIVSGYTLSGADAANYNLVQPTGLKANITPATLTYTANAATSIYGDAITGLTGTVTGFVNGENLANATTGTASFSTTATATSHVGQYAITGSGLTANNSNYDFVQNAANTTALTITPATLTITANAGQHKVYGDIDPTLGYAVSGWKLSDGNSLLTGALGRAAGKNVGNYAINQGSLLATSNYDISYIGADFAITPRTLTATINAQNKVYDGNRSAAVIYGDNRVSGDFLSITGNPATFSDKNAGSNKTVIVNGLTLSGADAGNYVLAATTATDTADISKAQAIVTANSLNTVYNGQNQSVNGFSATGLVDGEDESVLIGVSTAGGTGKNAGSYSHTASGTDSNYNITFVDGALKIAKAKATVTANSLNTVYNGQNQSVNGFSATGLVGGEDESVLTGISTTGGQGKNAGSYSHTALGTDSNYDLTFVGGALEIAKAKATVIANSLNTVYNGQNQSVNGFSATGLVGGEDESVLTGISTTGGQGKNAGSYSHTASGTDSNYDITFVDGALEIAKAKATVTANSLNTVYNGKDQTVTGFTASGLVAGEDEAVLSNVSASVTAQEVGNYANKVTGSDDNYELTFVDGVLSIQAKPIWGNPYQRAIRTQPVQQKPKAFEQVEIEVEGQGINLENIQTLGSN